MLNPEIGLLMTPLTLGLHLDFLMTFYGLYQLIPAPTHILVHSSSCIDLIFTNQPSDFSTITHSSYSKCHPQIIYSKLNLRIEYPPMYTREIGDYNTV